MARTIRYSDRPRPVSPLRLRPVSRRWLWPLALLALLIWSLAQAGVFERELVNGRGWRLVERFAQASLRPDLSGAFLQVVVEAALQTLCYAALGMALTLVIGLVGGVLASEVWWETLLPPRAGRARRLRLPRQVVRAALAIPRAIHELLLGLLLLSVLGLTPLTAILALGLQFGAVTAKVYAEILDETPREPFNAIRASGAPPLAAFFYGLLPQAAPNLIAYGFYRFECAIRASAVLGIIGAGGLGYQIFLSLQSLRYEQLWTLLYALCALSGLTDLWSSLIRQRLSGAGLCVDQACTPPTKRERHTASTARLPERAYRLSLPLSLALLAFALWYLKIDFGVLTAPRTGQLLADLLRDLFLPDLGAVPLERLVQLSGQTVAMSALAIMLAALAGVALAFPAARTFTLPGGLSEARPGGRGRALAGAAVLVFARALLLFWRAVPAPIWALVFMFVFFPGILPGALALGVYTAGVLGRLFAETAENLDSRPLRALQAGGASGPQVFLYGVLPAAAPQFTAFALYRWEVCIRETIVVGLVGAGGLGRLMSEQLIAFDYRGLSATLLCFILLTLAVDALSSAVRRRLR